MTSEFLRLTVADVIARSASAFGNRVALKFEGAEWTYADLNDAVTRAAAHLLDLGLTRGDRVAAYGKNSDAYLIGFLACARAGLVHVPINYSLRGGELDYLLTQSGARAVLVDPSLRSALASLTVSPEIVLALRDEAGSLLEVARGGTEVPDVAEPDLPVPDLPVPDVAVPDVAAEVSNEDLVQLLYTSGTTARPKGAMMTHRALMHEYASCLFSLDITAESQPLHVMPLYHSAQMHVFLLPALAVGATNTLLATPEPGDILRRIESDGHRAFFAAPTLWVAMVNHPDFATRDLSGLRQAYYGASIMPGPILARLQATCPALGFYNCFGQSELGPLTCVLRPEEHTERPSSAGRPALHVEMRVVDPGGVDVEVGGTGEIIYRSPQLCEGYWDKPEETAAAFIDGWFYSGDLVRIDEEGFITVVDRVKDVINTGGVLVASREIEDALYLHPAVAEAAVVGVPDEKWIEKVSAVVVLKGDATEEELIAHAREHLSAFKVPKEIRLVDALPRNASGKILKRELR